MRRVLIVSPHFSPVNTADMQRVRLLLPWLREYGWEPTVLAVAPESIEGAVIDPLLEKTYPADIRVVRVRGISPKLTRPFGIGSLWLRCGRALQKAGEALLARDTFDLIFFSTTVFESFTLGPKWLKKFGVPYVLDYHDPWVSTYYQTTGAKPPGGRLKYAFSQWRAQRLEPLIVKNASAIISVSESYGPTLCTRYPSLKASTIHHIPFGAEPKDIQLAKLNPPRSPLVSSAENRVNLVYTGRVVEGMQYALRLLFRAFSIYKESHPEEAGKIRFHFIGTDYAPPPLGRNWVLPSAQNEGVSQYVTEYCYRVPYFESLYYISIADALMIIGSDAFDYSASKTFLYLMTRKPVLTIAHRDSLMLKATKEQGQTSSYGFTLGQNHNNEQKMIREIHNEWFVNKGYQQQPAPKIETAKRHTASIMARQVTKAFGATI